MPKFQIMKRVDAFQNYAATIEAESLEAAMTVAMLGPDRVIWRDAGVTQFSASSYVPLDGNGAPLEAYERSHK